HLAHRRIPSYAMPEAAVRAVMVLDRYRRLQETLLQTPERGAGIEAPDRAKAEAIVKGALAEGREWLDEVEGKALLEAWGIPTVPSFREATPEAAGARAQAIGKPVALKLLSPDVVHKSEAGAVLLDVAPRD